MRKLNIILSVIILTALMTGCTVTSYNENIDEILKGAQKTDFLSRDHDYMKQLEAYDSTASALPAQTDEDGGFFDDFAEGLDPERWHMVEQQWGAGNNGVIRDNISYTDNGILLLEIHGDYYDGVIRTGACIASKNNLGPGSYEVKMKALPRFGVCTAMWTFYYDGVRNHEIDIEIPAKTDTFKNTLFTNWLTLDSMTSQSVEPSFYHNDGEWHTYRFDWHTQPERIDYYVDGVLTASSTENVPTVATNFWLGAWLPDKWCGSPDFDTAYMLVDWVKYTPFNEPHENSDITFSETPLEAYPKSAVKLPVNNFIRNGEFKNELYVRALNGGVSRKIDPLTDNYMMCIENDKSSASQRITGIIPNREYRFTYHAFAEKAGSKANIRIEFFNKYKSIGAADILIDNNAFKPESVIFEPPENTNNIVLTLSGDGVGKFYFENLFLTQTARNDFNTENTDIKRIEIIK